MLCCIAQPHAVLFRPPGALQQRKVLQDASATASGGLLGSAGQLPSGFLPPLRQQLLPAEQVSGLLAHLQAKLGVAGVLRRQPVQRAPLALKRCSLFWLCSSIGACVLPCAAVADAGRRGLRAAGVAVRGVSRCSAVLLWRCLLLLLDLRLERCLARLGVLCAPGDAA